jgi:dimethylargininase
VFHRAIVRPPSKNFAEGLTSAHLGGPDYAHAIEQHEAYCAALEQCGLALIRLAAQPAYPDSTFVEDTAVVIPALHQGRVSGAILTRPGAPSRIGEVGAIEKVLTESFSEVHSIDEPGTLDGGDICEAESHFFIGISERTNEAGAQQFAAHLASFGYSSSFVDIRGAKGILHLKSGIAYLGDNRLAIIDALANRQEFRGYELVRMKAGEEYAANCVRINDHLLVVAGYPAFEKELRGLGYKTNPLDMTEFQKMDGGLSCLSIRF